MNTTTKHNIYKLWASGTCTAASTSLLLLTPFFLHSGMSEVQVSFYLSFTQIVNLAVSLLFSGITTGYADSRKIASFLFLLCAVPIFGFSFFCIWHPAPFPFFLLMLLIGGCMTVAAAIRVLFEYKLPCEVMEMQHYSEYVAYQGIFSGVTGLVIGIVIPQLYETFAYYHVTFCIFALSALCMGISACFILRLKPIPPAAQSAAADIAAVQTKQRIAFHPVRDFLRLLQSRDFRLLLLPNLLRGIGTGALSMVSLIALRASILTEVNVSLLTSVSYIGMFFSSFLYVRLVRRLGIPWTGLIGGILFCSLIVIAAGGSVWFLVIYGLVSVGNNLLSNALPDMIYQAISQDIISAFHTWRLALSTLGSAVSTTIYGMLLDHVSYGVLLASGAVCMLVCVTGYFLLYRKTILPIYQS